MKILKKLPIYLFISCMAISLYMFSELTSIIASSISAGVSTSTVAPGGSFTVNVSINGGGSGVFYFSGSNATVGKSSEFCDGTCSITATAGSSGTATVSISTGAPGTNEEVTDKDGNPMSYSTAVSVSIIVPNTGGNTGNTTPTTPNDTEDKKDDKKDETKDSDSSLASLSVGAGELSPAFASGTTSYEVNLPAGTTKLTVDAKATNAKASVSGIGALDVITGENNIEVVCTAENGSSTVYNMKVNVSEKPVTSVTYGNKTLGVLNQSTEVSKLFTETKITVDGKEVIAWKNEALKMTLLYMQDEKSGEKNLYIYDEVKKEVTSIFKPFSFAGKNLVMVDVPKKLQERKGMKLSTIKLGDLDVTAWVFEDKTFSNYALLYVMDEAGNMVYYQYEKKENSLQLYSQAAAITQDSYQTYVAKMQSRNQMYVVAICALSIVSIGLLISTIVLVVKRKNNTKFRKLKIDHTNMSAEAKSLLNKE